MRWKEVDGKHYIHVTSLINLMYPMDNTSFEKWCEKNGYKPEEVSNISSIMGSKVSGWIDNYHKDMQMLDEPAVGKIEQALRVGVDDFLSKWELVDTEGQVLCDEFLYVGTYDGIVVSPEGERMLVDWKTYGAWRGVYTRNTSKLKKAGIQLSMYRYALQEDIPLAVVVFKPDGTYDIERREYTTTWIEFLKNLDLNSKEEDYESE